MSAVETKQGVDLLIDYLDVCNSALEAHRRSLPYKPFIAAYNKLFANRQVGVEIYNARPEARETVRLVDGKFEPVDDAEAHPAFYLKFKRPYMEDVVAHRQEYVQHPEKLDWDWLKSSMGLRAQHGTPRGANMRPPEPERYAPPAKGANMRPKSGRTD